MYFIDSDPDDFENILGKIRSFTTMFCRNTCDRITIVYLRMRSFTTVLVRPGYMIEIDTYTLNNLLGGLGKENIVSRCFILNYFRNYWFTNCRYFVSR